MFLNRNRIRHGWLAAIVFSALLFAGQPSPASASNGKGKEHPAAAGSKKDVKSAPFAWQIKKTAPTRTLKKTKIYRRLLQSTGWLVITDDDGRLLASATVWIIDAKRRLAITNWHCVNSGPFAVFFPAKNGETVITDPAHYLQRETPVGARVIDTDRINDLALIQLNSIPQGMTELPLARQSAEPGEDMYTVGGRPKRSGGLWQFSSGMVRLVTMQNNALGRRARIVQGQDGINQGNSGGALVNDRGEVIAVVEGLYQSTVVRGLSMSVDVNVVRAFADNAVQFLDPATAADFIHRGKMHLADRRIVEALGDFNSAIQRDPQSREAFELRGTLRYFAGDYRGAVDDFSSAVKHGSSKLSVYSLLGSAYAALGRTGEAISTLSKAIAIDSHDWSLYRQRGTLHLKAGDYKSADADLTTALEKMASRAGRRGSLQDLAAIFLARGMARYQLGRYQEALVDLKLAERRLKRNVPEARRARVLRGLCQLRLAKSTPSGNKAPSRSKQSQPNVQYVMN